MTSEYTQLICELCSVCAASSLDGHVGRAVGRNIASSGLVAAGHQHLGVAYPDLRGPHVAHTDRRRGCVSPESAGARAGR